MAKTSFVGFGLAVILIGTGNQVTAQSLFAENEGYATFFLGVTQAEDYDFDFFQTLPGLVVGQGTITAKTGGSVGAIIGLRLTPQLRAEFELSYSKNDVSTIGPPTTSYDGSLDATFGLFNLWYDIPVEGKFAPYAGGGLGFARVSHYGQGTGSPSAAVDDSDNVFAGQIGFGVRLKVNSRGTLDIGYRYKMTDDLRLSTTQVVIPTDFVNGNYGAHSLNIGYSFNF